MTLTNFMAGINLLVVYTNNPPNNPLPLGAEHDFIYFYPTERPLPPEVVAVLHSLGWFQPDVEETELGTPGPYDPEEGWAFYINVSRSYF